jgi:4-carboxymuconolactone decarboxylase
MTSRQIVSEVSPKLGEMTVDMLYGDIWERPELSKRDRSLITVANLVALYRTDQLKGDSPHHFLCWLAVGC